MRIYGINSQSFNGKLGISLKKSTGSISDLDTEIPAKDITKISVADAGCAEIVYGNFNCKTKKFIQLSSRTNDDTFDRNYNQLLNTYNIALNAPEYTVIYYNNRQY